MTDLSQLIAQSERILIFTGAGISTASGIPDYRGPKGIWKTKKPVIYQDFMSSQAARIEYWTQKLEDWQQFRDARPNAVHTSVAALEKAGKLVMCVTQNIDGLHHKAGTSRERLIEVHGTNGEVECQSCGARRDPQAIFDRFSESGEPPKCRCGGWLKPATISFGQALRQEDLVRAADAAHSCDLVIALGSTLSVYPAAGIPLEAAKLGAPYVIINRGGTEHDDLSLVALRLEGDVVELFPPAVTQALSS
jgi:NAD-dependent deacetylase